MNILNISVVRNNVNLSVSSAKTNVYSQTIYIMNLSKTNRYSSCCMIIVTKALYLISMYADNSIIAKRCV